MNGIDRRTKENPEACMVHALSAPKADPMDAYYAKMEREKKAGSSRACIDCKHMRLTSLGADCHKKAFTYKDPITGEKQIDRVRMCAIERGDSSTDWSHQHVRCGYEGTWFESKTDKSGG